MSNDLKIVGINLQVSGINNFKKDIKSVNDSLRSQSNELKKIGHEYNLNGSVVTKYQNTLSSLNKTKQFQIDKENDIIFKVMINFKHYI